MSFGLDAALQAGMAGLQSGLNMITGGMSARKQYKYTRILMDKQNEDNIAFWNMNNQYNEQYNSPAAQRARLEMAGLNPDMMYGNGAVSNTNMAQAPTAASGKAPDVDYGRGPNLQQAYMNAIQSRQWIAGTDDLKASAALKEAQAGTEVARKRNIEVDSLLKTAQELGVDLNNKYLSRSLEDRLFKLSNESAASQYEPATAEANSSIAQSHAEAAKLAVDKVQSELDINAERLKLMNSQTKLNLIKTIVERTLYDKFYSKGTSPNSGVFRRISDTIYDAIGDPANGGIPGLWKSLKNWLYRRVAPTISPNPFMRNHSYDE